MLGLKYMNVIVDYGMGNSGSILNMIRKVGGQAVIASDIDSILSASSIILPGVGNFDNGILKGGTNGSRLDKGRGIDIGHRGS
ncbi:MAG: hypothetical protein MI749_11050, partial [Desulfovibrionales bacterium]|nr:hypothetical protein [Desulfovibrionales bacterium]